GFIYGYSKITSVTHLLRDPITRNVLIIDAESGFKSLLCVVGYGYFGRFHPTRTALIEVGR
ncbi:hypothetical protein ACS2VB_27115, partial [Bacillus cereus group sp. BC25]|uniref:hypothetical protein n=1 Tax=Bacillus cereus group sp. BC25 TaxID=3445330 RepID=UPI003F1F48CB